MPCGVSSFMEVTCVIFDCNSVVKIQMYLLDQFREFLTSLQVFLKGVPLVWRVPLASRLLYLILNWKTSEFHLFRIMIPLLKLVYIITDLLSFSVTWFGSYYFVLFCFMLVYYFWKGSDLRKYPIFAHCLYYNRTGNNPWTELPYLLLLGAIGDSILVEVAKSPNIVMALFLTNFMAVLWIMVLHRNLGACS